MKDTLRQPDGKIRTACKFCRQRKKKCSGEMPCASCVNFNRDCCVYDRWSSSPTSSSRAKELQQQQQQQQQLRSPQNTVSWMERSSSNTIPLLTPLCFTSKVVLKPVETPKRPCLSSNHSHSHQHMHSPSPQPRQSNPSPFTNDDDALQLSLNYYGDSTWSQNSSPASSTFPLTPDANMSRTISLPTFQNKASWMDDSLLHSPMLTSSSTTTEFWTHMERGLSMASFEGSSPSQDDSNTSLSSPTSTPGDFSAMLSPAWYQSPLHQHSSLSAPFTPKEDTFQLLQDVDALLEQYGSTISPL